MSTTPTLPSTTSCCSDDTAVLTESGARVVASAFRALADPTRVRLVALIAGSAGGEACVCDLTEPTGLSQPTVSHHLKVLVDAGLLTREQRGRWAYYAVVPAALHRLARDVARLAPAGPE